MTNTEQLRRLTAELNEARQAVAMLLEAMYVQQPSLRHYTTHGLEYLAKQGHYQVVRAVLKARSILHIK